MKSIGKENNMIFVTIALTRYHEPDWLLNICLESIAHQQGIKMNVYVLDQSFHEKTKDFCRGLSSGNIVFEYHVIPAHGCAHARNIAIRLCQTDILLWTDPDVVHSTDWARNLASALQDHPCAVVGGKIIPLWHIRPRWYMTTNVMADHYSLIDLGDKTRPTDRIIGGNMGLHVGRLGSHARFDERLGRQDGKPLGGVDAEFCERMLAEGFHVHYVGLAVAQHQIPVERTQLKWIARKFYYGGLSRGLRGGKPRSMNLNRRITDYVLLGMFAPLYLAGFVYSRRLRHLHPRPMLKHGELK